MCSIHIAQVKPRDDKKMRGHLKQAAQGATAAAAGEQAIRGRDRESSLMHSTAGCADALTSLLFKHFPARSHTRAYAPLQQVKQ